MLPFEPVIGGAAKAHPMEERHSFGGLAVFSCLLCGLILTAALMTDD